MDKNESKAFFESETRKHIMEVSKNINSMCIMLLDRASTHDASKLDEPEASIFEKYTPLLKSSTYGSPEYNNFLSQMKVALEHHYAHNSHHPEHHAFGEQIEMDEYYLEYMNLIDILEMFCDWMAAIKRHADGSMEKSLAVNKVRFNISDDMVQIFKNTAKLFDKG